MRVVSQNGWPVLNADATTVISAGGRSWRVARGQVATVFKAFIARYAREVERIDTGQLDDWAWAVRNVRGSATQISNHASGTAIDINALRHPRGARGTFTREELLALHRLIDDFPVLRWGGTYGTTVDEMHYEINCTPAQLDTWQRTGTRPPTTSGGLSRPADPEDDDVVTRADIDAIAEAVWAKALNSQSDPRAAFTARDRLASLDYTLQALVLPTLGDMPAAAAEAVWDGETVEVRHPRTSEAEPLSMRYALGRAASVIWDGRQAGVLHERYANAEVATLDQIDDAAPLPAALEGLARQLDGIGHAVEALATALLDPMPVATAGSDAALPAVEMTRQTYARILQVVGLVSGVREALDTLAVAAAKGNLVEADKLQDAMLNAIRTAVHQVVPADELPQPAMSTGR